VRRGTSSSPEGGLQRAAHPAVGLIRRSGTRNSTGPQRATSRRSADLPLSRMGWRIAGSRTNESTE